jgi:hypothetical protein
LNGNFSNQTPAQNSNRPLCNHCHKRGHVEAKCWTKNPSLRPANSGSKQAAATTDDDSREIQACITENGVVAAASNKSTSSKKSQWLIDCGSSRSLTKHKSKLVNLRPCNDVRLSLADDSTITANLIGECKIKTDKCTIVPNDVLFLAELQTNILSVGQMQAKGWSISFPANENKCVLQHGNNQINVLKQRNGTYVLESAVDDINDDTHTKVNTVSQQ